MSKTLDLEAFVANIIEPRGFELVDLEYRKESKQWILRIFIDKPGGVTVDDCAQVSDRISFLLDSEDKIPGQYKMEVSSPGLDRKLKKRSDFERFLNSDVILKTFKPIENQRNFTGKLVSASEKCIVIEDVTTGKRQISYEDIALARLKI
ncbi:MAG: ribosome maturation factor RimP [bacterium]